MTVNTVRFYEDFTSDIKRGLKTQTIRYNWETIPETGTVLNAVSTEEGDVFAKIKLTESEQLSMLECVQRDLEGHVNYESVQDMVSDMSQYYPSISKDSQVLLFNFELVEWLRE